ncbi:HsmA family protein [Hugonella massiliensis]|uniref:HsmA family protein n=1 Tax=Hugonella massiliensis TaxID=1720315 RepID=UPI00073E213A|nr:HsmA family protein [Hugonella massiliensis]
MNASIAFAAGIISIALVFYTAGVFLERRAGTLRPAHLAFFYAGLACDTVGTSAMAQLAQGAGANPVHAIIGAIALVLMLAHALWATVAVIRRNPASLARFHRFSVAVWLFWLVPYVCGMLMGVPALHMTTGGALATAATVSVGVGGILCLRTNAAARRNRPQRG